MTSDQTQDQSPEPSVTTEPKAAVTTYLAYVGINEAARLTGKGKQQIYRDIQAGKLSWQIDTNGRKQLQIADLDRVYKLKPQDVTGSKTGHDNRMSPVENGGVTIPVTTGAAIELARLQERLTAKEDALRKAEEQIRDLQQNRDRLLDQNNRLTMLLAAPPAPTPAAPEPVTEQQPEPTISAQPSFWQRLFPRKG